MAKAGKRSGAWIAKEILRPEVEAMLQNGQSPDQIVFALLTVGYDVFRADMKKYPHLARIAMFMELARGTGTNFEKVPRDARLPKVRQPTGGKGWWIEDLGDKGKG